MSRHRDVRSMKYHDEVDGYDDIYGHSVEDDYCISPSTEAQFMYKRNDQTLSAFMSPEENIQEEDYESDEKTRHRADSYSKSYRHKLNETDKVRLTSCMEEIRNVIGETGPDYVLEEIILQHNFNFEKALDALLSEQDKPKGKKTTVKKGSTKDVIPESFVLENIQPPIKNKHIINNNIAEAVQRLSLSKDPKEGLSPDTSPSGSKSPSLVTPNRSKVNASGNGISNHSNSGKISPRTEENIDKEASSIKSPSGSKTPLASERLDLQAELKRRKTEGKELINLVVIGHVDAGKSTLMGHVLYLLGNVNKKTMHKYEQESKKLGKASFAYAWVLDETGEERSRGITIDVGQTRFESEHRTITLLDAPGHKDFIPNMITGAAQADVAILVVDATRGEFETGFESGGQTREHALLVRSLGVSQLAVAVNKLDTVDWSEERFQEICKRLGQFLKQAGYKDSDVVYIPLSGLTGENLVSLPKESLLAKWYKGPTLIQQIDNFKSPERSLDKPFRLCISDVFKGLTGGFCVSGKMEAGFVQNGDKVLVMPNSETAIIKGITIEEESAAWAMAGDFTNVTLTGIDMNNVSLGSVLCHITHPIKAATRIQARIVVFNIEIPITKGFQVVFHFKSVCEQATIRKLLSQLHKSTGEVIKRRPRCLVKHSNALIELEIGRPVCVELYKDYKELGRFMLRSGGSTIAAGLVTEIP